MKTATKKTPVYQISTGSSDISNLLQRYGCGPIQFSGTDNALYERHLIFDNLIDAAAAEPRELNLLLKDGDYYRHLPDLTSYLKADQQLRELYADHAGWARTAILNVASSGKFSSDRTITQYATDIWRAVPCPVS